MTNRKNLFEIEKEIHDAAESNNDPRLAEALLAYFREIRGSYLTLLELKSLFISFNGRGQGRGESQRYPLSEEDVKAFERVGELAGISTNSLEGVIRTHARATPELIQAQQERALSRQAADIISRLEKENSSLQGRVVQLYFEKGIEIKELADLVRKLMEHRLPERQEAILQEYLPKEIERKVSVVSQLSMAANLSQLLDTLQDMTFEKLDDEELLTLLSVTKRAIPILERARKECFSEVTDRFGG